MCRAVIGNPKRFGPSEWLALALRLQRRACAAGGVGARHVRSNRRQAHWRAHPKVGPHARETAAAPPACLGRPDRTPLGTFQNRRVRGLLAAEGLAVPLDDSVLALQFSSLSSVGNNDKCAPHSVVQHLSRRPPPSQPPPACPCRRAGRPLRAPAAGQTLQMGERGDLGRFLGRDGSAHWHARRACRRPGLSVLVLECIACSCAAGASMPFQDTAALSGGCASSSRRSAAAPP